MNRSSKRIRGTRWRFVFFVGIVLATTFGSVRAAERDALDALKVVSSTTFGAEMVELEVAGSKALIVKPIRPRPDGYKPWIWYAPSLTDKEGRWTLPGERHAAVVKGLLEKGLYLCGVDVGESYGSPAGRATFTKFHRLLVDRYGFAPKACLFPVSRGGLMHYGWAVEHPECVQCIGAIYPVCSLESYPGIKRASQAYGLTEEQLRGKLKEYNPLDRLAPLAAAGVPIFHLHGDQDEVVPLQGNSRELARRYRMLGGKARIIVIEGKGHEIVPEFWEDPRLPEFFAKHALAER